MCSLLPLEFYLSTNNVNPVLFCSSNVQKEMEFQIGSTLQVKSCKIASLSYISRAIHRAGAAYYLLNSILLLLMQNLSFPKFHFLLGQEIDFQLGSTLPVKSCKIASLSYISRAKHCAVYYLLNYILLLSMQNLSFL